jgi:hypothetical protein
MSRLPDDVLARAFRARNGELAWSRQDAVTVAEALVPASVHHRLRYHLTATPEAAYRRPV